MHNIFDLTGMALEVIPTIPKRVSLHAGIVEAGISSPQDVQFTELKLYHVLDLLLSMFPDGQRGLSKEEIDSEWTLSTEVAYYVNALCPFSSAGEATEPPSVYHRAIERFHERWCTCSHASDGGTPRYQNNGQHALLAKPRVGTNIICPILDFP